MKDNVCIVTGASSGIGKATALGLVRAGATVVVVCRSEEKGRQTVRELAERSGRDSLDLLLADLSSMGSVRKLAQDFRERHYMLHLLVNNAGTFHTKRGMTVDGFEQTFAVNYLSRFLLTALLLDIMKKSAPARVVNVAGASHARGKIDFQDLQMEQGYDGMAANNRSKLADVLFTYELARRTRDTGITANCLHPGPVATGLVEKDPDFPRFMRVAYKVMKRFLKSPEKAAEAVLYLATSPEVAKLTGKYFVLKKAVKSSPESYDLGLAERLWQVSLELVKGDEKGDTAALFAQ